MTRTQAELVLLVALLIAAWLVVGTGGRMPSSSTGQGRAHVAIRDEPVGQGLSERRAALRAYLTTPQPRASVRRDPFSFRESSQSAGRGARVSAAAIAAPDTGEPRPEMVLSGIAEETSNGHPVRTAVISARGQLVFAREGDRVLSRFLVVRIAADAVQLKDGEGGEVFTLALK
ncbi:MAG TPA: hypothetical protein VF332_01300 [Vicinamibacterales bacterium]